MLRRWLPLLLAVVAPLALLAGVGLRLAAPLPAVPDPVRGRIDAALARRSPEGVVLGASKVATDLDLDVLAPALGARAGGVAAVAERSSTLALWYALLENRVYRAGHRPAVVLVYATLDELVSTEVPAVGRASFLAQLGEDEPVLTRKVFGGRPPTGPAARARDRAEGVRAAVTGGLRDVVVGVLLAPPGGGTVAERGRRHAAPALDRVFGPGRGSEGTTRVLPVVEEVRAGRFEAAGDLDATLLPDLVALVREHGGRLVVVRAPVRGDVEAAHAVPPALARAAVGHLREAGALWVDLTAPPRPDGEFGDPTHLNPVGRRRVSAELAARLVREEAGELDALPTESPAARRTGTPPPIRLGAASGVGPCAWSAPIADAPPVDDTRLVAAGLGPVSPLRVTVGGTELVAHTPRAEIPGACRAVALHGGDAVIWAPPPGASAPVEVGLSDALPLLAPGAPPAWWVYPGTTLELGLDGRAAVWAVAFGGAGGTARLGEEPLVEAGPWRHAVAEGPVRVSSPADGPWLYLQRVEVDGVRVIGARGASAVGLSQASVAVRGELPALLLPAAERTPDGVAFSLTGGAVPSPARVEADTGVSECTPLRPAEAGRELPLAAGRGRADRVVTQPERLLVKGPRSVEGWSLVLAQDRRCRGGRWLYPGDRLLIEWASSNLARLPVDPTGVALVGALYGPGPVRVHTAGGSVGEVDAAGLAEGRPLPVEPIARWPGPVRLELEVPADTWAFLVDVSLVAD